MEHKKRAKPVTRVAEWEPDPACKCEDVLGQELIALSLTEHEGKWGTYYRIHCIRADEYATGGETFVLQTGRTSIVAPITDGIKSGNAVAFRLVETEEGYINAV